VSQNLVILVHLLSYVDVLATIAHKSLYAPFGDYIIFVKLFNYKLFHINLK